MKERLDIILAELGYAPSREKAKSLIKSGKVYVNGQKEEKAGAFFEKDSILLQVREAGQKYVGRGGYKLEKALEEWDIDLTGQICMDIGASTGGFTDCMLQHGAAKVYAVDTGRGQLAEKLREDARVICMEQTNFRYMVKDDIEEELDFASVDVSFISLTKILVPAGKLLKTGGGMVCLIKPQFEAGRENVGKRGVVRKPEIHRRVLSELIDYAGTVGFSVLHLDYSPFKGAEGNIEYLMQLKKEGEPEEICAGLSGSADWKDRIARTVKDSHELL